MKPILKTRRGIPFFYPKSEAEFRADPYENHEEMIVRQSILHLCDDWHDSYLFQPVLDWILEEIKDFSPSSVVDIGCSVGRQIAELAEKFPDSKCWGIDYSYQALRQANDYFVKGKTLSIDGRNKGFGLKELKGKKLTNLQFGLAKGEDLPFSDASLDLVCSSFTLDRFEEPLLALKEIKRILKPTGKCLIVSPLNFKKEEHWNTLFPLKYLLEEIDKLGFLLKNYKDQVIVKEALDKRGNYVIWNCVALHLGR